MPSEYRWVLGPGWTGMTPTTLGLCFDLDDIPMPGVSDPQTADVQLYHRPMEGTGSFSSLGTVVYDMATNAFCLASVPTSGEFALGSSTEPLPVSLRTFHIE